MPNPQWPSIAQPTLDYPEQWEDPTIRSESEGGYVQTRRRHTRDRRTWTLTWSCMSSTDYATLVTFYRGDAGAGASIFDWAAITDNGTVAVRFKGGLKASYHGTAYRVECTLEEV